jgi:hypothetical protein
LQYIILNSYFVVLGKDFKREKEEKGEEEEEWEGILVVVVEEEEEEWGEDKEDKA